MAWAIFLFFAASAQAAPQGGQVSAGQAEIHQAGTTTTIDQSTPKAAINWQNFDIAPQETVQFRQPDTHSVTLNRVLGNERSVIDGTLKANGQVFIQNPNGMMIGKNAQINVGALLATSGKISDQDFMSGNYRFQAAQVSIENLGHIQVPPGGTVALIAPIVQNQGTIGAPQGNILLASAQAFSITLPGDAFAYTLGKGSLQGLVDNGGIILADGGHVVLTALGVDTVKKSLIRHRGVIEANTVLNRNGKIELWGDLNHSELALSGSLKAEAPEGGDGGFIETSAAQVKIADSASVSTQAANGQTGQWLIDPNDFVVAASGGDISGAQLSGSLNNNNVTLKSIDGKAAGKGDIHVNDGVAWNKNVLSLNAQNDIKINVDMRGSGSAQLELKYGQATASGGKSDYILGKNGSRSVKIDLPEGPNLLIKKGSDGTGQIFNVMHSLPEIQADGIASFGDVANIAFGRDMDLSYTANKNGFSGWNVGENARIHGLGHILNKLTIQEGKERTGLIRQLDKGEIRGIGLTNVNIKGYNLVGGLVGLIGTVSDSGNRVTIGSGKINDSYVTGSVAGNKWVGGLVGFGANIHNSHTNATVSGDFKVGGLLGFGVDIENSYSEGKTSGDMTCTSHNLI